LGRKKREEDLERELLELRERCSLLEKKFEEIVKKTEGVEKGVRLLTEAVYRIIAYLKNQEWPREEKPAKFEAPPQQVATQSTVEYLTETEHKILGEVEKRGVITASECLGFRKRLLDSFNFLHRVGFFEDYSDLAPEEIYKRISRKIKCEEYLNKSDTELDYDIACLDEKRVFKVPEILEKSIKPTYYGKVQECVKEGELESLLNGLVRISRGTFQPRVVERSMNSDRELGFHLDVRGKYMGIEFACKEEGGNYVPDLEKIYEIVSRINIWIKDTEYQYYSIGPEGKAYVVLSKDEAEKLERERGWRLFHPHFELDPEIRKRLMNSMDFLRKTGFFEDYSNLSSWEILEKIFSGEIDYTIGWEDRLWDEPQSAFLKEAIEKNEGGWVNKIEKIDYNLVFFDNKRFIVQDWKIVPEEGMGVGLLKKLARISRGVFNPTDIREEFSEWNREKGDDKLPLLVRKRLPDLKNWGTYVKVFFKFRGKEFLGEFYTNWKYLDTDPLVEKINELIRDTGYQYYTIAAEEDINYFVASQQEVEELKKRGWDVRLPKD